ncbi:MAG TPA: winged helix-turn-helix domain-containing protein [candidate division Zixibacteria bacterium]|nr:winged helix-turn-helix domain-containing protein [candidate division Zixibacteria bacterium]
MCLFHVSVGREVCILASTNSRLRSHLEIIASILDACRYSTKKTHLMYLCNMSFRQLEDYLDLLLKTNVLSIENGRSIILTASSKGKDFLKAYNSIKTMMESLS